MATSEEVKQPTSEKPPTQGVGVNGFQSDVYAADEKRLIGHT